MNEKFGSLVIFLYFCAHYLIFTNMRHVYFSLIVLLVLSSCHQTKETNSLYFHHLNGQVKSVTQRAYNAQSQFGEVVKLGAVEDFYSNGISYDAPIVYSEYDEDGYMVCQNKYIKDGELYRKTLFVWDNHRLIEQTDFNATDSMTSKIIMEKGDKNLNKGFVVYDGNGNKQSSGEFVVDEDGNEIDNKSYDANGNMTYRVVSEWQDGLLQKQKNYSEHSCFCTENTYKGKQLISAIMYDTNEGDTIFVLYNEQKDVVSAASGSKYPYVGLYEYVYDEQNNWIKRIYSSNGEIEYLEEREIVYY